MMMYYLPKNLPKRQCKFFKSVCSFKLSKHLYNKCIHFPREGISFLIKNKKFLCLQNNVYLCAT